MDIVIIIFALGLFTILAFKGVSAVIMGPLVGLIVSILAKLPVTETMLGPFMKSTAYYVERFFLVFFLGAVFGAIYEETGAAKSVAIGIVKFSRGRFSASIVFLIGSLLTFGGISGFVVFFVLYPIALQLFRENDISRKILPGAISAGSWTISMIAPNAPSIQNIIASRTLGTSGSATPIPGWIGVIFELVAIIAWLEWRTYYTKKKGQLFNDSSLTPLPKEQNEEALSDVNLPNFWLSLIPLAVIVGTFNVCDYLRKAYPQEAPNAIVGVLKHITVEGAVFLGIILSLIMFHKKLKGRGLQKITKPLNTGGVNGVSAIMNTAVVVGFGGVVQQTAGFKHLVNSVLSWNISPLWFVAIAVGICAGAVGSASGGITIAFESLKDTFVSLGVNLEYVHRIGVIAAGTLDTLPHQGAQITLLNLCHLTHKEGYLDIAVTQIIIPILALFVVIPVCTMGL